MESSTLFFQGKAKTVAPPGKRAVRITKKVLAHILNKLIAKLAVRVALGSRITGPTEPIPRKFPWSRKPL